jgi:hypothetical protein
MQQPILAEIVEVGRRPTQRTEPSTFILVGLSLPAGTAVGWRRVRRPEV